MPTKTDPAQVAGELRVVLGRLLRRLRAEHGFPISQGSVLGRLDREGPQSVSDLASSERVRPQSMAQTVGELEAAGLVQRRPDPDDRRRQIVELTATGTEVLHEDRRRRVGWLAEAIANDLTAEERDVLRRAVPLLERLAEH
jgi:DNA-binding MarR family transcriptional regulator